MDHRRRGLSRAGEAERLHIAGQGPGAGEPTADLEAILGVGRGWAAHRDDSPGAGADLLVAGTGPGEWTCLAASGAQLALVGWLRQQTAVAADLVTVVDITHGRVAIRLSGPRSADVLARECPIDVMDRGCPNGTVFRSVVAEIPCEVIRDDRFEARSYLIMSEWSTGRYLYDALRDARACL